MHELSIAEAVVDIVSRHAAGRQVYKVELKVGHLRQVVPQSLEFAFELLTDGTELEDAELTIEQVAARGRCGACGAETTVSSFPLQCGSCGSLDVAVLAGDELLVDALELEEEMTTEGIGHGC